MFYQHIGDNRLNCFNSISNFRRFQNLFATNTGIYKLAFRCRSAQLFEIKMWSITTDTAQVGQSHRHVWDLAWYFLPMDSIFMSTCTLIHSVKAEKMLALNKSFDRKFLIWSQNQPKYLKWLFNEKENIHYLFRQSMEIEKKK